VTREQLGGNLYVLPQASTPLVKSLRSGGKGFHLCERPLSEPRTITHRKPFTLSCDRKSLIEADELKRRGSALRSENSGGKLEGIGSTQRMNAEETPRDLEDRVHRLDATPALGDDIEATQGFGRLLRRELTLAFAPSDRGGALNGSTPPYNHSRLIAVESL
jgi:hypothetical protein